MGSSQFGILGDEIITYINTQVQVKNRALVFFRDFPFSGDPRWDRGTLLTDSPENLEDGIPMVIRGEPGTQTPPDRIGLRVPM